MIFKFLVVSDEVDNFKREIQIDGDDTFFDLHRVIMKCTGYDETEMASFFMCDDYWKRKQEISLFEMDTYSDEDSYVMDDETLSDWLDEEKQRLIFVFDYNGDRGFYMELSEMILGENLSKAICTKRSGDAPTQFLKEEEVENVKTVKVDISAPLPILEDDEDNEDEEEDDESFYGEDAFNSDELDMDGFEGVDGADTELDIPDDVELF